MRKLLAITTSLLCLFGSVQSAHGCSVFSPLSKMDVAFADLIIEAKIIDVWDEKYVFEVIDVVRGDYHKESIELRILKSSVYLPPKTVEEFVEKYDRRVRLGIMTDTLSEKVCSRNTDFPPRVMCFDYQKGESRKMRQLHILNKHCGSPYIFPIDQFEASRDFAKKYKQFEDQLISEQADHERASEIYNNILDDVGPLPWHLPRWHRDYYSYIENQAVDFFHNNNRWFTEGTETFESDKDLLRFLGVDFTATNTIPKSIGGFSITQSYNHPSEYSARKIELLASKARIIKKNIKTDPEYADRLLESD